MPKPWALVVVLSACLSRSTAPAPQTRARLVAHATLPAETFVAGPPSGRFIREAPFPAQPAQGFSALQLDGDAFLSVSDNGYGVPETSSDAELRVWTIRVDGGSLTAEPRFVVSDPTKQLSWPIRNHFTTERVLTGADLDPESIVRAPDGTYWLGDEFGPFLVHLDARGRVLEPPFSLELDAGPLIAADSPFLAANLMLRSMEALRAHAWQHDAGTPIISPDHELLTSAEQVRALHAAGFRVVPWTVNEPARLAELATFGIDGVITDRPDLGGWYVDAGRELHGHRGGRGLAPENTPAAFRSGLAAGANVLELDLSATADDDAIVWHDGALGPPKCPRVDGGFIAATPIRSLTKATCDGLLPARFPLQRLDAGSHRVMTLADALALPGTLNVETKVHDTGLPHDDAEWLARLVHRRVVAVDAGARVMLQSFDWRALTVTHREAPTLQTVALIGDRSIDMPDATRAGLPWPQRSLPVSIPRSSGFENLALVENGNALIAMLEKPLAGAHDCLAFRFDLSTKRWSLAFRFPLDPRATAVGDLTFIDDTHGYALERDDSERTTTGFKRLMHFTVQNGVAQKQLAADLLSLELADGGTFTFPFWTIEGVAVLPNGRVAIINDNNLPFGRGRSETTPDDTELIVIEPLR